MADNQANANGNPIPRPVYNDEGDEEEEVVGDTNILNTSETSQTLSFPANDADPETDIHFQGRLYRSSGC